MPAKATAITVTYTAWDSGTGGKKTGDVTNHTCQFSKDGGVPYTLSDTPSEVGSGVYKVALSASDTNCDTGTLIVTSVTSGVVIPDMLLSFSSVASSPSASDNATAVWGAASRTLTASPTDISSLATSSAVSTLQTSVNAIPTTSAPSASDNATAVWGAASRTLTASPTDTSSLATAASVAALATILNKVFALVGRWKVVGDVLTAYGTDGTAIGTWDLTRDVNRFITEVKPSTPSTS